MGSALGGSASISKASDREGRKELAKAAKKSGFVADCVDRRIGLKLKF
jgi:hypothetical protein